MYLETTIIYKNGSRMDLNFSPSLNLYLTLTDYITHSWGCEDFATSNLTKKDIQQINKVDDYLKPYLKEGCYIDCIIHRGFIIGE